MKIEKKFYPDGSFYPVITDLEEEESLIFRINNYNDLWFLKQIKDVLDYNKVTCDLTIPCLLDAQADRRFNYNESSNLKLVCDFINNMKWNRIKIFHPHNQEVVESLIDNVYFLDNSGFILEVLKRLQPAGITHVYTLVNNYKKLNEDFNYDNLILMSSDAGGFKPLMKLCEKIQWKGETYSASKSRKYENDKSSLIQHIDRQDFQGKDILIVDDLCVYGGTFVGLAKMLKEKNCGKLYLAISHLTVDKPNPELFKVFDKVFTTDSKNLEYLDDNENVPSNLEIVCFF